MWPKVSILASRSPRVAQLDAKIAQRASDRFPLDPQIHQKRCRVIRFYTSGFSAKIAPKISNNPQDSSPKGLQMAILAPSWAILALQMAILARSWAILAPSWPHVAPILAPSWAICLTFWGSRARPKSAKTVYGTFSSGRSPRRPPRPPPGLHFSPLGPFFLSFLGRFWLDFLRTPIRKERAGGTRRRRLR